MPLFQMQDRHPKGHTCLEKLYLLISSNSHSTVGHWLGKSTDCRSIAPKKRKILGVGETGMKPECTRYFLNLIKKPLFGCGYAIREKSLHDPSFFPITPLSPKNSGLLVLSMLSMLLLFYTMSTTVSKPQGAWQGNQKGIPRMKLDALKDDLRTPSQKKRCNRFIANCFQKAE